MPVRPRDLQGFHRRPCTLDRRRGALHPGRGEDEVRRRVDDQRRRLDLRGIRRRELMGEYVNGRVWNAVAWGTRRWPFPFIARLPPKGTLPKVSGWPSIIPAIRIRPVPSPVVYSVRCWGRERFRGDGWVNWSWERWSREWPWILPVSECLGARLSGLLIQIK